MLAGVDGEGLAQQIRVLLIRRHRRPAQRT